jgi:tetratricopeptide (TPR) repeat protein
VPASWFWLLFGRQASEALRAAGAHAAALAGRRLRAGQPLAPARTGRPARGAIADAQALVAAHPQRSAADWFNLAFLLESADRLTRPRPPSAAPWTSTPKLDRAWYGLGLTLIRLGRHDEAVKALKRNTKLQPMSPYGWYQLARVQLDRQEPDEALKIIRHLKGFEPKVAAQLERETGLQA